MSLNESVWVSKDGALSALHRDCARRKAVGFASASQFEGAGGCKRRARAVRQLKGPGEDVNAYQGGQPRLYVARTTESNQLPRREMRGVCAAGEAQHGDV